MARQNSNTAIGGATENVTRIKTPLAGERMAHDFVPGGSFAFEFNPLETTIEREGSDLTFSVNDGGTVAINGFFSAEGDALPDFILPDGTMSPAQDVLDGIVELETAAGPGTSPSGGGSGEYSDDGGELIGGIDRLGSLGTNFWSSRSEPLETLVSQDTFAPASAVGPGAEPVSEPPHHARLVISNNSDGRSYSFVAQDKDGNLIKDASRIDGIRFKEGTSEYFTAAIDPVTGRIVVSLTEEGKKALARGEKFDDVLKVSVDGEEYEVDLLGNDQDSYDYIERENETNFGDPLTGEWYASNGKTINGEEITLGGIGYNEADIYKTNKNSRENVSAVKDSDITIADGRDGLVNIEAVASNGNATGLETSAGKTSSITGGVKGYTDSEVNIKAASSGGNAYGVDALGNTDIYGSRVTIEADAARTGTAVGVFSRGNATTTVKVDESLDVSATSGSVAYGVKAEGNGKARLVGSEDGGTTINVTAASNGNNAHGMAGDARIEISGDANTVSVNASNTANNGNYVYGMDSGAGIVLDDGDNNSISVSATSQKGEARGMNNSTINLTGDNNTVDVSAKGAKTAVAIDSGSRMTVTGDDNTVNFSAETTNKNGDGYYGSSKAPWQAHGMWGATVDMTGQDNTVNISSKSAGYGEAYGMSHATINARGDGRQDINIKAASNNEVLNKSGNSDSRAIGMRDSDIYHEGTGTIHVTTDAKDGEAIGLFTNVRIDAKNADLLVDSHSATSKAQGIAAWQWEGGVVGHNSVAAKNITLNVSQDQATTPNNGWPLDDGVYGLSARHFGNNRVTASDALNINVTSRATDVAHQDKEGNAVRSGAYGMEATGKDTYNEVKAGTLNVNVDSNRATAYGLFADDGRGFTNNGGGRNTVTVDKDATINVNASNADAYGSFALGEDSRNSLTAGGDVNIGVTAGAGKYATGVYSGDGGSTSIKSGGDVTIDAKDSYYSIGLNADGTKSAIAVTGKGTVNLAAEGGYAQTISAQNGGGISVAAENGDVSIAAKSKSGWAQGIGADDGGTVDIGAANGSVDISATGATTATGILSQSAGSSVNVAAEGDITVTARNTENSTSNSVGINANLGGTVSLDSAKGDITVVAETSGNDGRATGIDGNGETLRMTADDGSVRIRADGHRWAYGLHGGATITAGKDIEIEADSATEIAYGIRAVGTSTADLTARGTVAVEADGQDATGIYSYDHSTVNINASNVTVTANAGSGTAQGVTTANINSPGYTNITSTGDVRIEAQSRQGGARGVMAETYGNTPGAESYTAITGGGNVAVSAKAGDGDAIGVWANAGSGKSANTIKAGGDITVNADSSGVAGYGVLAETSNIGTNASNKLEAGGNLSLTVTGDSQARGVSAVSANGGTAENTIVAGGDVNIDVAAKGYAYGIHAESQAKGTASTNVTSGGNVTITAQGDTGYGTGIHAGGESTVGIFAKGKAVINAISSWARGIFTEGGAEAVVEASEIAITANATNGKAHGVNASGKNSRISLDADKDVTVNAEAGNYIAYGVHAENGGESSVNSRGSVAVSAKAGWEATALGALDGGKADIVAAGDVNLEAEGTYSNGIFADGNAQVGVTSTGGDVAITSKTGDGELAVGIGAHNGSRVNVTAEEGAITVDASGRGAETVVSEGQGSSVTLEAKGDITINGRTTDSDITTATGLYANARGEISLDSKEGDVVITVEQSGASGAGVGSVGNSDTLRINAEEGSIRYYVNGEGEAKAIHGGGQLNAGKDVVLNATSSDSEAIAINSVGSSRLVLEAGDTATINATGKVATGVFSYDQSDVQIKADTVNIKAVSTGEKANHPDDEGAVGVSSSSGAFNSSIDIKAREIEIIAEADGKNARGMETETERQNQAVAQNTLTIEEDAVITATSKGGEASGLFADASYGKSVNSIEAANIAVKASSDESTAYGIQAESNYMGNAENRLKAEGNVTVTASGNDLAYGMAATSHWYSSAENSITAGGDVTINANSPGYNAGDAAYGMAALARSNGVSKNSIDADRTVSIDATGKLGAYGMHAATELDNRNEFGQEAVNEITASAVEITATASDGVACGMNASTVSNFEQGYGPATNSITASEVTITADGSAGSYAMRADGSKTLNEIKAIVGEMFSVTLTAKTGSFDGAVAMWADKGGNVIDARGSAGADINITGQIAAVRGGTNTNYGSDNNDSITLNGRVASGSLIIQAGDGYDTLTLVAESAAEFATCYQTWLSSLTAAEILGMSIEEIAVDFAGADAASLAWLYTVLHDAGWEGTIKDSNGNEIDFSSLADAHSADSALMDDGVSQMDHDASGQEDSGLESASVGADADGGIVHQGFEGEEVIDVSSLAGLGGVAAFGLEELTVDSLLETSLPGMGENGSEGGTLPAGPLTADAAIPAAHGEGEVPHDSPAYDAQICEMQPNGSEADAQLALLQITLANMG